MYYVSPEIEALVQKKRAKQLKDLLRSCGVYEAHKVATEQEENCNEEE